MSDEQEFDARNRKMVAAMAADDAMAALSAEWLVHASRFEYSYHFRWLGLPVIQFPQDLVALQEIIWSVKPDLVIETGVARGGSVVFFASLLELIGEGGHVVGIDVDLRPHNRAAIERHPLARRITLLDGSSVDPDVASAVREIAGRYRRPMVVLDSMHTHEHVAEELRLYAPLVRAGSYVVVLDTVVESMPPDFYPDRLWGRGDNPGTAVAEFLASESRFEVDRDLENKLQVTVAPGGYLRCLRDAAGT